MLLDFLGAIQPLLIALGIHLVVVTGGIDLSCEGVIALSGIVLARLYNENLGFSIFIFAIFIGGCIGLFSGFLHVRFNAPSFIITLGISWFCEGVATIFAKGQTIPLQDEELQKVINSDFLGFPTIFLIALFFWIIVYFFQRRTILGTYLIGIGTNEALMEQSGIDVKKFKLVVFGCAGILYGLATVLLMARLNSANVRLGNNLSFPSITAIVVGGVALSGGKGNAFNVFIGVAIIAVINMGLVMMKVNPYIQGAVNGMILIVSILFSTNKNKLEFIK